jgi:hypothetical protein
MTAVSVFDGSMLLRIVAAIVVPLGVLAYVQDAIACSCLEAPSVESAVDGAHAVFEARVADSRSGGPPGKELHVVLDVTRSHKGAGAGRVEVVTASDTAACGYPFQRGKDYLVYAHRDGNELAVSLCSRTRLLAEATEDLRVLATAAPSTAPSSAPSASEAGSPPPMDIVRLHPVSARDEGPEPRRGGCAGCVVGTSTNGGLAGVAAFAAIAVIALRARRRRA